MTTIPATIPVAPVSSTASGLRLWPGVVIVALQWLVIWVPGWIAPITAAHFYSWFLGGIVGALALIIWWMFFSRLRWGDRWLALVVFAAAAVATYFLCEHDSINFFGLIVYGLPIATTAWGLWLVGTPALRWPVRRAGLLIVLVLAWGWLIGVRCEGTDGMVAASFRWRWSSTAEKQFLADLAAGKLGAVPQDRVSAAEVVLQPGDWPAFRGPNRDGRVAGVRIATDWKAQPPRQVWRHRIGPGWSSFALVAGRVYTQEQRGPDEQVVCYDAGTGEELWAHRDAARFTEMMAGPGPRATPTFHEGKIFALGATGLLNCLDAATGQALWSRDIAADSGAKVPQWGFAASPLIVQGVVTVFAGGPDGKSVLGYDAGSGELAWAAGEGQFSYASLHSAQLGGVEQLLMATDRGLAAFGPTNGEVLWQHNWPLDGGMARVIQPTLLEDGDVLLGTGFGHGLRRVHVGRDGAGWTTQEVWTTRVIKPYFNDQVIHQGHLYGFDNNFLICVSLADGKAKWKERGYGNGQVLLLADQGLLLVLSEQGEAALIEASPVGCKEIGRFQAIEGKTWNHPVVAHGKLYVRNGEEAACYELAEGEKTTAAK